MKTSTKIISKYSAKSNVKYAAKRITSAKSWRNNRLATSAWSAGTKYSVGTGLSNTITNTWAKVKSWFSGIFK